MIKIMSWLLVILAGLNSTAGNYFLKKSQQNFDSFFSSLLSVEFLVGCSFYFFNVLLFAYSLKELEVSKAYPVLASISFISLMFLSFLLLDEAVSLTKVIGLILIIMGIIFISQ
mgnify:CR=1 FL=1